MKSLVLILSISLVLPGPLIHSGSRVKVERDDQLIVPGFGAEQVVLGDRFDQLPANLRVKNYKIIESGVSHNLLRDVFKASAVCSVDFDRMIYFESNRFILLIKKEIIVCIVSFNRYRVTIESVDLSQGLKKIVSAYKKYSYEKYRSNKNIIYNFKKLGLGIVDDGNDDVVDVFFVFPRSK